jgi:putative oxidoreductase
MALPKALREPIDHDLGLLVIRLGIGVSMFAFHGYEKLTGGPQLWAQVGTGIQNLGINFLPAMWGFMAALSESVGSVLLVLGFLFRPAAAMLAFTMLVAALMHVNLPADNPASGWSGASHALELLAVYVGLLLAGPGRYGLSLGTRQPSV